jgi:hypothetical protein
MEVWLSLCSHSSRTRLLSASDLHAASIGMTGFSSLPTWANVRSNPVLVLMEGTYLLLQKTLDKRPLAAPDVAKVLARL